MEEFQDYMLVCLNGHIINNSYIKYRDYNTDFCNECGEKTIYKCQNCNKEIKGRYHHRNSLFFGPDTPPNNCHNCGEPYPWTNNNNIKINNKEELTDDKKSKVFIVHGHDDEVKDIVARFIEKIGLEAIILHEQSNVGQTIIEKLESNTDVGFGIILYTYCDLGNEKSIAEKSSPDKLKKRARQNVIFEHGYLIGKIGRKNTCALVKDDIEKPTDINGIVYIQFDKNEGWKNKLVDEMKSAGYQIDKNKI